MELSKAQKVVIARRAREYGMALEALERARAVLEDLALALGGPGARLDLENPLDPKLVPAPDDGEE